MIVLYCIMWMAAEYVSTGHVFFSNFN